MICGLVSYLPECAVASGLPPAAPAQASEASSPSASDEISGRMADLKAGEKSTSALQRAMSLVGLFVFVGVCYLMSNNRPKINWKLVAWGLGLQFIFGVLVLKTEPGLWVFS